MPRGTRSRLECDAGAGNQRRVRSLKKRVDANGAGKPLSRAYARGLEPMRLISIEIV